MGAVITHGCTDHSQHPCAPPAPPPPLVPHRRHRDPREWGQDPLSAPPGALRAPPAIPGASPPFRCRSRCRGRSRQIPPAGPSPLSRLLPAPPSWAAQRRRPRRGPRAAAAAPERGGGRGRSGAGGRDRRERPMGGGGGDGGGCGAGPAITHPERCDRRDREGGAEPSLPVRPRARPERPRPPLGAALSDRLNAAGLRGGTDAAPAALPGLSPPLRSSRRSLRAPA